MTFAARSRRIRKGPWSEHGIIGCVGAGIGVTLLPRAVVARAEAEGRVALHALPSDEGRVETVLVRRRDAFISTALRRFIEIARSGGTRPRSARLAQHREPLGDG